MYGIRAFEQGLESFHSYLALNHIIFKNGAMGAAPTTNL